MGDWGYERPDWVRRLNAMGPGVGGAAVMVGLDPDELIASAEHATQLDDFGGSDWEEPYRRLVQALDTEARLNVVGRLMTRHDVLRFLCTRLALVEAHRRDPTIALEEVVAPIFITGPARSGTSILQELMAEDPSLRAPLAYEMAHPVALPGQDLANRAEWAESEFELWADVQPEFAAVHNLESRLPEECLWLFAPDFDFTYWTLCVDVTSFLMWRAQTDPTQWYRYHRQFLQVLQHGHPAQPWILKSPVHVGRLAALFAVYPDARVIRTHRDPVKTVPSTVSAVALGNWMRSDHVDPENIGATVSFGLQMILNGAAEQRASDPRRQIAELHYLDLLRDPVEAIARSYGELGIPFDSAMPDRITRYLAERPQGQHGTHRYPPEDFGLDAEVLRQEFLPYTDAFGIELEA